MQNFRALHGLLMNVTLAIGLTTFPAASNAIPVGGQLNATGAVTFSSTATDFTPPAGGGNGGFTVAGSSTGSFAPLIGTSGLIKDLGTASQPVNSTVSLADFMTFTGNANIHFTLTFINPGTFSAAQCAAAPAAGQTCTPAGSAFNYTNATASSSTQNFSMKGTVLNLATSETSTFVMTVSSSFPANYQQILGILRAGGSVSTSHSATAIVSFATLDIDDSNTATKYDALTDGLLAIRYMFGLTGVSLTAGALGPTARRTDPAAVKAYLDAGRSAFDIDGDGNVDALTDGLLILRYLFGLRGAALIQDAFVPSAPRNTPLLIEAYLGTLTP